MLKNFKGENNVLFPPLASSGAICEARDNVSQQPLPLLGWIQIPKKETILNSSKIIFLNVYKGMSKFVFELIKFFEIHFRSKISFEKSTIKKPILD